MTHRAKPLERVRDANPFKDVIEPDWGPVRERMAGHRSLAGAPGGADVRGRTGVRWGTSLRIGGVLAGLALCAATAIVVVLALASPGGSPDFLARAAVALSPARGAILYERWKTTFLPEAGNPERRHAVTLGPDQLWIEGDRPHRYRTVLLPRSGPHDRTRGGAGLADAYGVSIGFGGNDPDSVLGRVQRKLTRRPLELGGAVEAGGTTHTGSLGPTLTFLPSNDLLRARLRVVLGPSLPGPHDQIVENGADPVGVLRAAIAEGRAHVAGPVRLGGRTVQRIDISLPQQLPADAPPARVQPAIHAHASAYADVEPGTFHPVEIVFGGEIYRFLAYEYLPATAANLKLTDIRAQHPQARILDAIQAPSAARP